MENLDDLKKWINDLVIELIKGVAKEIADVKFESKKANKKIADLENRLAVLENDYKMKHHSVMMDKDYYDDYYK
jgi:peptidoglycan hydrolase CwlO-like protein